MIYLTAETKIMVAVKAVDFRKAVDGLSKLCEYKLCQNPRNGTMFVFINKDRTMIRILVYEINGYWLMTKRLSKGKFDWSFKEGEISEIQGSKLRQVLKGMLNENRRSK
jgi:transposase